VRGTEGVSVSAVRQTPRPADPAAGGWTTARISDSGERRS